MIISHKFRLIFIKTVKTAGTSIEVYLSPHCGPGDILTPVQPPIEGHEARNYGRFYNHYSAWGVRQAVPAEIWNNYLKICVERNPWDKTVSQYCMLKERMGGKLEFSDYLSSGKIRQNWELYTDLDNTTLLVDRVLRYERLDQDLGEVFEQQGIPWSGHLDVYAKSNSRKDKRHYREWYSEEQQALIARVFSDEIREFGYAF